MDIFYTCGSETVMAVLFALCVDDPVRLMALELVDQIQRAKNGAAVNPVMCARCHCLFQEQHNGSKNCVFHPGIMEPDYDSDFWCDEDEEVHGPIDTQEHRKEHPEGFEWDCCGKRGDEIGCKVGRHESNPDLSKVGAYACESHIEEEIEDEDEDEISSEEETGEIGDEKEEEH